MRNSRGTRSKHKIRQRVIQYIEENIRSYLILLIVFFIGIILGIIFINNSNEEQVTQITTYINNFIDSMKNNYQISTNTLLIDSIINNVSIAILLWFLGSTVIGVPLIYLVIGYKGYCIGFTIFSYYCYNWNRKRNIIHNRCNAITKHNIHSMHTHTCNEWN